MTDNLRRNKTLTEEAATLRGLFITTLSCYLAALKTSGLPIVSERQQLRKLLRARRRALSAEQQAQAALALKAQIIQSKVLEEVKSVAIYLANDGEINPGDIITECWQKNITTSLPVLHPFCTGHLLFLNYHSSTEMVNNKYGIPEPKLAIQEVLPKQYLDVIFVPLTGFDKLGNRIGMGGGYYDRTLSSVDRKQTWVIGLAHQCQQVDNIPTDSWDIPLDMIITDETVIQISTQ